MIHHRRFAYITDGELKTEHLAAAEKLGVELVMVSGMDPFAVDVTDIDSHNSGPFSGVVVEHPAAALRLAPGYDIGVFEGAIPRMFVDDIMTLHVYSMRSHLVEISHGIF